MTNYNDLSYSERYELEDEVVKHACNDCKEMFSPEANGTTFWHCEACAPKHRNRIHSAPYKEDYLSSTFHADAVKS